MILTTDALLGGTLILSIVASTTPAIFSMSKKVVGIRQSLVAESVALQCNTATFQGTTTSIDALPTNTTVDSDCGVNGESVTITFPNSNNLVVAPSSSGYYEISSSVSSSSSSTTSSSASSSASSSSSSSGYFYTCSFF
jgi:hypothetical protein